MKTVSAFFAALSLLVTMAVANAADQAQHDRRVLIVNDTSYTMTGFYASNVDRDAWEEDVLGESVLEPGHEVTVDIDDGTDHCMYDLKAVFDGENEPAYSYRFDVCRNSSWTIHE